MVYLFIKQLTLRILLKNHLVVNGYSTLQIKIFLKNLLQLSIHTTVIIPLGILPNFWCNLDSHFPTEPKQLWSNIYIFYTFPKNVSDAHLLKAWKILKPKLQLSATVGRRDLFRTTDKCPKSCQHWYCTCHVCSSYHKLGRSCIGNLSHSVDILPRIKQHTLLVPRATSNPIREQKYREKLKSILSARILISINQLSITFLFLLGRNVCWFLVNSRLTLVSSLTDKHELWQILILPPALPRFS